MTLGDYFDLEDEIARQTIEIINKSYPDGFTASDVCRIAGKIKDMAGNLIIRQDPITYRPLQY